MPNPINPPAQERESVLLLLPKLFLVSAIFWIPMVLFLIIANEVRGNMPLPGDVIVLQFIRGFANPGVDTAIIFITNLGGAPVVTLGLTIACALLYLSGRRRDFSFLVFSAAGTVIINIILKLFFQRSRPDLWDRIIIENGFSFPSGHAMISSAIALSIIVICWHGRYRLATIVVGIIYFLSVGISRLYLGVHYPSDVVAGWCVSFLWVATVYFIFRKFGRIKKSAPHT